MALRCFLRSTISSAMVGAEIIGEAGIAAFILSMRGLDRRHHNGTSAGGINFAVRIGTATLRSGLAGSLVARRRPRRYAGRPFVQYAAAPGRGGGRSDRLFPPHAHRHAPIPEGGGPGPRRKSTRPLVRLRIVRSVERRAAAPRRR